jgi:hypothetical protein
MACGLATGLFEELRVAQFLDLGSSASLVRVEGRTAPAGPGAAPRLGATGCLAAGEENLYHARLTGGKTGFVAPFGSA